MKSLRGKRGEDLIWNGNAEVSKANRASVKITFDNTNKFLDIDFPEVTIERVVHRDGSNEYSINGSQVRLKDIAELLFKANIGSTGHHIISQGEADRILSASAKERRSMVEDALGLKGFQYKKEESVKKLSKTRENIDKVSSLRREIAPHMRFLKKQVEKIEKAEEMRRDLTTKYREYLARETVYLDKEGGFIEKTEQPLVQALRDHDEKIAFLKKTIEEGKEKGSDSEVLIQKEEELRNVLREKENLMLQEGRLIGEKESIERLLEEEKRNQAREETKTVPLRDVRSLLSDIEDESNSEQTVSGLLQKVKAIFATFLDRFKEEVETDRMETFERNIRELTQKIEQNKKEILLKQEAEQNARKAYEEARIHIEKQKDDHRDAEKEVYELLAERQKVASELHDIRMKAEIYRRDKEAFVREIDEGRVLIGDEILLYKNDLETYREAGEERAVQEERRKVIERIKIRLEDMGAGNGAEILKEYKQVSERDEFLMKELEDLEKSVLSLENLIKDLDEELRTRFHDGLVKINTQFNNFFSLMFGGGKAELKIVKEQKRRRVLDEDEESEDDTEEETEEGVEVDVALPRKRIRGLMMLSGGERALTSIALLFAVSQVNPPPFIILDETDAALDEANSRKYGDMIESLATESELILITHNRETMARAGNIYGVTMGKDGVSKLLSISFDEASRVAK